MSTEIVWTLLLNMFLFAVYNRDCSPEVDDVEGLAAAATEHLELLKQKDEAESSFIIYKILGK